MVHRVISLHCSATVALGQQMGQSAGGLLLAEEFWVLRFRLTVKRGPLLGAGDK
jgi:hypothetical protein